LKSTETLRDFDLTIQIPKTDYNVGDLAEAVMTLTYHGDEPVELLSAGGEYFDILMKDTLNNIMYRWSDAKYGGGKPFPEPVSPPASLPSDREMIMPGLSFTASLEFRVPQSGTLYLKGYTFHSSDGSQVLVTYPDGHGEGVNNNTPFLVIQAR
jgi:hypothetical protein